MKIYKNMVLALPLLCCACSSDEQGPETVPDASGGIAAVVESGPSGVSQASRAAGDEYLHNDFILDRSVIRVANTVNYSAPDFTDGSGSYYEYVYTKEGVAWDDNEPNFYPLLEGSSYGDADRVDEDGGFDWNAIVPTSSAFVFEAACYPMKYRHFDAVATDQSTQENFWSADLLLAHTRKTLSERYDLLKLRFWHVFSMIRMELRLPVAEADEDSGFPGDDWDGNGTSTVAGVTLNDVYVTYSTSYTESIENYGSHTVAGTSAGGRQNITMYRLPGKDEVVVENGRTYQTCMYAAIVPVQQIRTQENLLTLSINTITGFEDGDMGRWKVEEKSYVFRPEDSNIDMMQGSITVLRLTADSETLEPVLVGAEVMPWNESYTEIDLTPVSSEP